MLPLITPRMQKKFFVQRLWLHLYIRLLHMIHQRMLREHREMNLRTITSKIKHFIAKDCKMLLEISSTDKSGLHVFNFLANSILKEVLSAIQKVKPGAFSPGRPTEFLKNYKASLDFLAYLEGIAGALDSALTSPSLVFIQDSDLDKWSSPKLMLRQSATLLESLRSCWKEDVLVFSAADKFLRLTLQLL